MLKEIGQTNIKKVLIVIIQKDSVKKHIVQDEKKGEYDELKIISKRNQKEIKEN